jgi:hypothetical protein
MLEYAHQWQDIRRIWTAPTDPYARAIARVRADEEYRRVGLQNISQNLSGFVTRRLTRGIFLLWAAEIPVPYRWINGLPGWVVRAIWAVQAAVILLSLWGVFVLVSARRIREAALLGAVMVYVTLVHAPLLTEARQSLPAMPAALVLAAAAVVGLIGRSRSLPLKPQVHEGEHLLQPGTRL